MTKKTILLPIFLMLFGISSLALAHTVIKDQAMESHSAYTDFAVGHGCGYAEKPTLDVIAVSVTFPNGPGAIITRADTGAPIELGDVLIGGRHSHGLVNPAVIQDHNVFWGIKTLTDETKVVRGIHYFDGAMNRELKALLPFRLSGVTFNKDSCVTKVRVRIAIANWCHHREGNRRVDVWMGKNTPLFNDPDVTTTSSGFWPMLTINRDLENNPLPASCGDGFEAIVEPSDQAIDTYLPMAGFIPGGTTEGGGE